MSPRFLRTLFVFFLTTTLILTLISIVVVSAQSSGDDDEENDGVIMVNDLAEESESRRRARFGGGSQQFDDFGDEARQKNRGKQQQQQQQQQQKDKTKQKDSSSSSSSSSSGKQKPNNNQRQQKQNQNQQNQQQQRPKPSYSSATSKGTLTDQLAAVIRNLRDVESDFAATGNHLTRLAHGKHFNASSNDPGYLRSLSRFLPSMVPAIAVVDGDTLESASNRLATARFDIMTLTSKIKNHEKQIQTTTSATTSDAASDASANYNKKHQKIDSPASAGDLNSQLVKLQGLQKNLKVAESLIATLVTEDMNQRAHHKRLMRAAKYAVLTTNRYMKELVRLAEERLGEIRGVRTGDIDGAAPTGDASVGRRARREFQTRVKKIAKAQASFAEFGKLLEVLKRKGRGLTKKMEALYVWAHLVARSGLSDDVLTLLTDADKEWFGGGSSNNNNNNNNNNNDDEVFSTFGKFLLQQHSIMHDQVDPEKEMQGENQNEEQQNQQQEKVSQTTIDFATKVMNVAPQTPTGVAFGLDSGELVGLVLVLVVPSQCLHLIYSLVMNFFILPRYFPRAGGGDNGKDNNKNNNKNKKTFLGQGQKLGGKKGGNKNKNESEDQQQQSRNSDDQFSFISHFHLVFLFIVMQVVLPPLVVDLPFLRDRIEDFSVAPHKGPDITLPSLVTSMLRLQSSNRPQLRLLCCVILIVLGQAYVIARTVANVLAAVAAATPSGDGDSDEE